MTLSCAKQTWTVLVSFSTKNQGNLHCCGSADQTIFIFNMPQYAIPAQNFILFLSCTSSFEVFHSKTDEFGLAAGPPLCRRAYHVRFECTRALLPKGQDSFVLRRLSWSECVVLVDYGDFHQRSKMKIFFSKVALKVSCLQVLDVLTWKWL